MENPTICKITEDDRLKLITYKQVGDLKCMALGEEGYTWSSAWNHVYDIIMNSGEYDVNFDFDNNGENTVSDASYIAMHKKLFYHPEEEDITTLTYNNSDYTLPITMSARLSRKYSAYISTEFTEKSEVTINGAIVPLTKEYDEDNNKWCFSGYLDEEEKVQLLIYPSDYDLYINKTTSTTAFQLDSIHIKY